MSIPSDNPILLARSLGPSEADPATSAVVSLAVGDGEIVALMRNTPTEPLRHSPQSAAPGVTQNAAQNADATAPSLVDERTEAGAETAAGSDDTTPKPHTDVTALLRCLAGVDVPATGELWIKGVPIHTLRPAARLRYSHAQCAVLPRTSRLLPELSMADNAALPLLLAGVARAEARRRALTWLDRLEVGEHALDRTYEVSPAVIRRVSIARALLSDPAIFFADEPVLGLDAADGFHLLRILRAAAGTHGLTMVIATEDAAVADWADRRIALPAVPVASAAPAPASAAAAAPGMHSLAEACDTAGSRLPAETGSRP